MDLPFWNTDQVNENNQNLNRTPQVSPFVQTTPTQKPPVSGYRSKLPIIIIGIILFLLIGGSAAGFYAFVNKGNYKIQQRILQPQDSKQAPTNNVEANNNKIFYVLFHGGKVSGYAQSQNPNLLNDAYSEIYSIDPTTKESSVIFSDKNENYNMFSPIESRWYAVKINNSKLFYNAQNRKPSPEPSEDGFFLDLNTDKPSRDSTLQNISLLSSAMNGKLLAYTTGKDRTKVKNQNIADITIKNTTTGEEMQVVDLNNQNNADPVTLFISQLSISPNGSHVAVATINGGPPDAWEELVVVDVANDQVTKVIKKDDKLTSLMKPIWVDNSHLIFAASKLFGQKYNVGLYTLNINGNDLKNIYTFTKIDQNEIIYDVVPDSTGSTANYLVDVYEKDNNNLTTQVTDTELRRVDLKTGQTETLKNISSTPLNYLSLMLIY